MNECWLAGWLAGWLTLRAPSHRNYLHYYSTPLLIIHNTFENPTRFENPEGLENSSKWIYLEFVKRRFW
jgi:hypothetical protein